MVVPWFSNSLYSLDSSFFVFLISNKSSVSTGGCRLLLVILMLALRTDFN